MALYMCIVLQQKTVLKVETLDARDDASAHTLGAAVFERVRGGTHFELWSQDRKVTTQFHRPPPSALKAANGKPH